MFYTQFPPKDISECKIDVSDVTIDPLTLRNAEHFGWAYHIKGGIKSMKNLKKNRRFWTLIGTKLYKFKDDISQAEEPACPTGGIELEQAHVYLDQTRNNTIIIHTELIRFALMPEQRYLQKMSQLLAQRVHQLQSSRFIDFVDKIPVEVVSQKSGSTTVMVPAAAEEPGLEANTDYDTKSDEDKLVVPEIKYPPIRPANSNVPKCIENAGSKTQFIDNIEMDNKMSILDDEAEDKFIIIQDVDRPSVLPPPPPQHSNEGDVPLPPPPPAIQPHRPKPRSSLGPDFNPELKQLDSDAPPDDPVGCASPILPEGSLLGKLGIPPIKESGKIMIVPPEISPTARRPPTSGPPLFTPATNSTPGVLPPVCEPPPIPTISDEGPLIKSYENFSSCTGPPRFNAHQKDKVVRTKPPLFKPREKNSTYNVGPPGPPPVFKPDKQSTMSSARPPLFVPSQKSSSSGIGPPPAPSSVSHQVCAPPAPTSSMLSTMDRSLNKIKQSPPPLPLKIKLGLT